MFTTRSISDGEELVNLLLHNNVKIISNKSGEVRINGADDKFIIRFKNALAQHTSEKICEKTINGISGGLGKGTYTLSHPPYGYKRSANKTKLPPELQKNTIIYLIPIQEELDIVVRIFDLYTIEDYNMEDISKIIFEEKGVLLKSSRLAKILKDRKYTGVVEYRNKIYKGFGLVNLITKEQYQTSIDKINHQSKSSKYDYIFKNKLFCSECGHLLHCKPSIKKTGKKYFYYECLNTKCSVKKRVNENKLLELFNDKIINLYNRNYAPFNKEKQITSLKGMNRIMIKTIVAKHMKNQEFKL